jgi:excisionase family DNA binding protein
VPNRNRDTGSCTPTPGASTSAPELGIGGQRAGQSAPQLTAVPGARRRAQDGESRVPRRLLSMRDAAQYLGVSYWTVRAWCESGRLPAVRLPAVRAGADSKLIRVELSALERLVDAHRDVEAVRLRPTA